MSNFSPMPSYLIGIFCIAIGSHVLLKPSDESERFGIPLPSPDASSPKSGSSRLGTASPFIYVRGIREVTWGLNFLLLQHYNQELAITILLGVVSLASLGDGWVVWTHGDERLKKKAFAHSAVGIGCAMWFLWRTFSA